MADARPRSPVGDALEERMARIRPASYSFDDLIRRRARRQRNTRLVSAAVALALVVAMLVALRGLGGFGAHARVPASPGITAANASRLGLVWVASSPWPVYTPPAVEDGRVYAAFADGTVAAYPTACSPASSCRPLWTAATGVEALSGPTVANGMLYVAPGSTNGSTALLAYSGACALNGQACSPRWVGVLPPDLRARYADDAAPIVSGSSVIIVASGLPDAADTLVAFPLTCPGRSCAPTWTAPLQEDVTRPTDLAAEGDTVYVAANAALEAFGSGCATGGRECLPLWIDHLPAHIDRPPVVRGGIVEVGVGGTIVGVPAECQSRSCPVARTTSIGDREGDMVSSFAMSGDLIVAGREKGGIVAVRAGCRSEGPNGCRAVWTAATGRSPDVTAADGLIFVGAADGVYAFDPLCSSDGGGCRPLWFEPIRDAIVSVTRTAVYVGSSDGRLAAFTVESG